jgi:hypothetical protein
MIRSLGFFGTDLRPATLGVVAATGEHATWGAMNPSLRSTKILIGMRKIWEITSLHSMD